MWPIGVTVAVGAWLLMGPIPTRFIQLPQVGISMRSKILGKRREQKFEAQFAVFLVALRSASLSGNSLMSTFQDSIRDFGSPLLPNTLESISTHGDVLEALSHDSRQLQLPILEDFRKVMTICLRTGAPIQQPIDRLIQRLHRSISQQQQIQEELASAKATALVLMALPAFGPVLGSLVGINILHFLVATPWGFFCLVLGAGLELLGWFWMRLILQRVQQHA